MLKHLKTDVAVWATAFVLSLAQWRHTAYFFGENFVRAVQAAQGVLAGYPHWRFFQSRLLGPWVVSSVSQLFGFNFAFAHIIVAVAALTLCSVLCFTLGTPSEGVRAGGRRFLLFRHCLR